MDLIDRYGIEEGDVYEPADGSTPRRVTVTDTKTYAHCNDVVVAPSDGGEEYRIDAFKLHIVRYRRVTDE